MTPIQIFGVIVLVLCGSFLLLRVLRARRLAVREVARAAAISPAKNWPKGSLLRALTLFVEGDKFGELQNAKIRMRRVGSAPDTIETEISASAVLIDGGAKVDLVALLFEEKTTAFTFALNDVAHVLDGRVMEAEILSEFREGLLTGTFKIVGLTRRATEMVVVRNNKWAPPIAIIPPALASATLSVALASQASSNAEQEKLAAFLNGSGGVLKVSVTSGIMADG